MEKLDGTKKRAEYYTGDVRICANYASYIGPRFKLNIGRIYMFEIFTFFDLLVYFYVYENNFRKYETSGICFISFFTHFLCYHKAFSLGE